MTKRKRLTFWGADENDDSLLRSVMDGRKTVTAKTVEDYYKPYGDYGDGSYEPGDVIEVYGFVASLGLPRFTPLSSATFRKKSGEAKHFRVQKSFGSAIFAACRTLICMTASNL
jgi:hypothetical protein